MTLDIFRVIDVWLTSSIIAFTAAFLLIVSSVLYLLVQIIKHWDTVTVKWNQSKERDEYLKHKLKELEERKNEKDNHTTDVYYYELPRRRHFRKNRIL